MRYKMQVKHHVFAVAASTLLIAAGASTAWAHAELKQATPAVDGTVQAAPAEVTLKFSERLESPFSTIIVRDAVGKRVDKASGQIDKADRTVMRASLQPLSPGIYIVEWRALTTDTHRTEGAFIFHVGQ
jgi:methionine-rich copper-binding protein CopC